ncbi:MAG: hypothetical protein A3K19_02295 [Lentisphaerae bacterium RIFOXYB12_FULL_65_16]|nr:MAG: hypothetical protein A3K18_29785 [Lentisphaerae bacterium RIFOXYA12_64_32]OGV86737.1 MAG: hypothetical protein A3K19_02295 [Lentisphaerae bacterium RIFOXYB12_FULL_65_16]
MQLWIWRHWRLNLPDDWEMLQFSRNPLRGSCAFADRYQFRLEFHWRKVDGPPDFGRMMSDYEARLKEDGMAHPARVQRGAWQGIEGHEEGVLSTRFGRHFPEAACLVEVVFLWPEKRDRSLTGTVLDSIAPEPAYADGLRRWRAFGMDCLVSPAVELDECDVQPACVELRFCDPKHHTVERFARRGMVSEWLKLSMAEWLRVWVGREARVLSSRSVEHGQHRVESLVAESRAPGLAGACFRYCRSETAAWICPQDKRLYSVALTRLARGRYRGGGQAVGSLSCCSGMELRG